MSDYQVLVHYHNPTDDYLSYNIWQWQENQIGKASQAPREGMNLTL